MPGRSSRLRLARFALRRSAQRLAICGGMEHRIGWAWVPEGKVCHAVVQAVPFRLKPEGLAKVPLEVPWNPKVTWPPAASSRCGPRCSRDRS